MPPESASRETLAPRSQPANCSECWIRAVNGQTVTLRWAGSELTVRTSGFSESPFSDLKNRGDPAQKPLRVQRKPPSERESHTENSKCQGGMVLEVCQLLLSCWFPLVLFVFCFYFLSRVALIVLELPMQTRLTSNSVCS